MPGLSGIDVLKEVRELRVSLIINQKPVHIIEST
jgi:hypothetical protein